MNRVVGLLSKTMKPLGPFGALVKKKKLMGLVVLLLALLIPFQNCSGVKFDAQAIWEKSSMATYAMKEDEGPKKFKLPLIGTPLKYRILIDESPVSASQEKSVLNGKLLEFDEQTGDFTYKPNPDYNGHQELSFEVLQPNSTLWSRYRTDLIVEPVNDQPSAKDAYLEPEKDKKLLVTLKDFQARDIDGDRLSISILNDKKEIVDAYEDRFTKITRAPSDPATLEVISSLIGATSVPVRISDGSSNIDVLITLSTKNPLSSFQPALAVNKTQCLFCHSQVRGNFVSTMGTDAAKATLGFHGHDSGDNLGREFDYMYPNYTDYYSRSLFMTSRFEGKVFVPKRQLAPSAQLKARELITEAQQNQTLIAGKPATALLDFSSVMGTLLDDLRNPKTGSQYFFSMINFHTSGFQQISSAWGGFTKTVSTKLKIEEVKDVRIAAPSEAEISSFVNANEAYTYYPQGATSRALANFGIRSVRPGHASPSASLYGNDPTAVMDCDGDLFVKGAVILKNLRLRTKVGCRIHATGAILLSGALVEPASGLKRGYLLVEPSNSSNLELVSARAVLLGLGYVNGTLGGNAPVVVAAKRLQHPGYPISSQLLADVDLMVGPSAQNSLVLDAGTDPAKPEESYGAYGAPLRDVHLNRILINAPILHSRYTGDFKGVVIGDFALWSLGKFKYEYDPVFDQVPILPMIKGDSYFKVESCDENKKLVRHPAFTECQQ